MATKSERREDKRRKARHGMKVRGRSVLLLAGLEGVTKKKSRKQRRKGGRR